MDDTKYLLPQEIVEEEILTRLPVKSLMRFRCVSKSWRSLIDSDRFAKIQYRNSLMNTSLAHHRVIFRWRFYEMKQCSLRKMLDGQRLHASPFDEDTDISLAFIVGCCNGLFCLHRDGYLLWNPATKLCNKLPEIPPTCSPFVWSKRGFGWDEATGAYKVFALSSEPDGVNSRKRVARVYSSGTRSWTTVDHGSLNIHNEVGLYACGSLHWVAGGCRGSSGSHIECFDLKSEAFGNMEMPPLREHGEVKGWLSVMMLGEVKGWLSVMCDLRGGDAVVWVMKEYGVQESWQKLIHVPRRDNMRARPYIVPRLPGGEMSLLLSCGSNFYVVVCDEEVMNKRKKIKASSSSSSRKRSWCSRVKCWLGACCYDACFLVPEKDGDYNTFIYAESLVSPYH